MRWTLLTLAMLLPLSAYGQSDDDCAAIEDEAEKALCYVLKGDFFLNIDKSNFDDSTTIFLYTLANEFLSTNSGSTDRPILYITCKESTTAMVLTASDMLFTSDFDGFGRVRYRVDDRTAGVWSMQKTRNNKSLGFWSGRKSIPAIEELFGGDVLRVRFARLNETPAEVTFNITGLEQQIAPLREACNWQPAPQFSI